MSIQIDDGLAMALEARRVLRTGKFIVASSASMRALQTCRHCLGVNEGISVIRKSRKTQDHVCIIQSGLNRIAASV